MPPGLEVAPITIDSLMAPPRLEGTWLDFQHQNSHDGAYWNAQTAAFRCAQWQGKVREIQAVGMDTIVLMSTALDHKAFFPSAILPVRWTLACNDPVAAVLSQAASLGMAVYVSVGFYGHTTEETSDDADYVDWHKRLADELFHRYEEFTSFAGWYVPNEAEVNGHFSDGYMEFMPPLAAHLKALDQKRKVLIAPYGTRKVAETPRFVDQLQELGVDNIAWQDEVGVRKTRVDELDQIYARLKRLHDRAGIPLWADIELFDFEGETYASPLVPAPIERISAQYAAIQKHVDKALSYQFLGLMNPPASLQYCGHPASVTLWRNYNAIRHS